MMFLVFGWNESPPDQAVAGGMEMAATAATPALQ
jgi:hypothetical protein